MKLETNTRRVFNILGSGNRFSYDTYDLAPIAKLTINFLLLSKFVNTMSFAFIDLLRKKTFFFFFFFFFSGKWLPDIFQWRPTSSPAGKVITWTPVQYDRTFHRNVLNY